MCFIEYLTSVRKFDFRLSTLRLFTTSIKFLITAIYGSYVFESSINWIFITLLLSFFPFLECRICLLCTAVRSEGFSQSCSWNFMKSISHISHLLDMHHGRIHKVRKYKEGDVSEKVQLCPVKTALQIDYSF